MERKKVTIADFMEIKREGKKITMLTAYDYPMGYLVDKAGIDIILIGDSLSMVTLGHENTLPVTMDEMIHHAKAVRRGAKYAFLVGDMPFMSYNVSREEAIRNAGRFIKEAGCESVKLEGGFEVVNTVRAIVDAGIPVMAHIGLTPQTATKLGGFKVQGKDSHAAQRIIDSAVALEEAGAFAVLMECVPDKLAGLITKKLKVPTIGIGAGPDCDGQVLIIHDIVGLYDRFLPKFAKQYVNLSGQILSVIEQYRDEVRTLKFPAPEHCFTIKEEELKKIK